MSPEMSFLPQPDPLLRGQTEADFLGGIPEIYPGEDEAFEQLLSAMQLCWPVEPVPVQDEALRGEP